MLDIQYIRENREKTIEGLKKRQLGNAESLVGQVIALDQQRRQTQHEMDSTKADANNQAKNIGKLKKEGKHEEAQKIIENSSALKAKVKEMESALQNYELQMQELLYLIPNLPSEQVPPGSSSEQNVIDETQGEIPPLGAGALPHWELVQKYNIIDFELGNKVTGAGFPFYKGQGARLQRALINFFLDEAIKAGYREVQTPLIVNQDSGTATGQLPDKEGQMYHISNENFYLIPTAEVSITNMYRDVILREGDLPIKHAGHTPCFRREAGSWGADVRGLNRLHQFDKVEIVHVEHPERSYQVLEEMKDYVKGLLEKLELPYRVLKLCAGDLGFTSAFTYDLEVFSAAQQRWLEVSSVSNFETYQSKRLQLRFRNQEDKIQLAHTLNGSALALPRIVAALLENNQTDTGIKLPQVLHAYTGFEQIT